MPTDIGTTDTVLDVDAALQSALTIVSGRAIFVVDSDFGLHISSPNVPRKQPWAGCLVYPGSAAKVDRFSRADVNHTSTVWPMSIMQNDVLLLGIDVGTTNCKALLFDTRGHVHAAGSTPTPTIRPRPNWAEYDPEALWSAVVSIVRQVLAQAGPQRVHGVAVASMAEAGVLLDAQGRPVYPIISWYDQRTVPQYNRWIEQFGYDTFFTISGILPHPIYSVFKLMWLRDTAPEAYARAVRWLHVSDYIAFRLCGAQVTDYSLATRTMLFDLQRRAWSEALVERAGLRYDLLPEVVPGGTRIGTVTPAAAAETGLAAGTAVGAGGHDHICGAFAADVRTPGTCLDSMGTAEAIMLSLDTLRLDQSFSAFGCSFGAHVARDTFYVKEGIWSSGGSVAWAERVFALPETRNDQGQRALEQAAAQVPAGSLGAFFVPSPSTNSWGAFVGLTPDTPAAACGRAVYEGLAYEWRRYLEQIERLLATRVDQIKLIGGGTRSELWCRIKADVLGRPLRVVQQEEAVALGAALLGGLAAGVYQDEAEIFAAVQIDERRITPDPDHSDFYNRCYHDVFLRIAPALDEVHRAITDIYLSGA